MTTKTVSVRLNPETYKDISYLAEDQHCSLQEIITNCLESRALAKQKDRND